MDVEKKCNKYILSRIHSISESIVFGRSVDNELQNHGSSHSSCTHSFKRSALAVKLITRKHLHLGERRASVAFLDRLGEPGHVNWR